MRHRYLDPHWWSRRLAPSLSIFLPDQSVMNLIGRSALFGGEPELRVLRDIVPPKRVALDVGAADGVYSWHLARVASSCIAFEPNPASACELKKRLPNVEVMPFALSDVSGQAKLRIPLSKSNVLAGWATIETANSLSDFDAEQEVVVETRTLDSLDLKNIGFMKIDVEGHEMSVLHGGERCILRDKPILLIEIEEKHSPGALTDVTKWLQMRGYYCDKMNLSPQNYLFRPKV
jgi:FkbM family methyltransferase